MPQPGGRRRGSRVGESQAVGLQPPTLNAPLTRPNVLPAPVPRVVTMLMQATKAHGDHDCIFNGRRTLFFGKKPDQLLHHNDSLGDFERHLAGLYCAGRAPRGRVAEIQHTADQSCEARLGRVADQRRLAGVAGRRLRAYDARVISGCGDLAGPAIRVPARQRASGHWADDRRICGGRKRHA
jgi:hypothetical protein